jgi:hypothetical protein
MRRFAAYALAAAIAQVAQAQAAQAKTFCVSDSACVSAGGTAEPDLQAALTAVGTGNGNPGANTISVGAGTFVGNFGASDSDPLTIKGAGRNQTILQFSADNTVGLAINPGNPQDSISGLSIASTAGNNTNALSRGMGTATDIAVTAPASSTQALGVSLVNGATLANSSVQVGSTTGSRAVAIDGGGAVTDDTLSGQVGVQVNSGPSAVLARDRITAADTGVKCFGATCLVQDSLITAQSPTGYGLLVTCTSTNDASGVARNDTILGPVSASVFSWCQNANRKAEISVDSSILRDAQHAMYAEGDGASTTATVPPPTTTTTRAPMRPPAPAVTRSPIPARAS